MKSGIVACRAERVSTKLINIAAKIDAIDREYAEKEIEPILDHQLALMAVGPTVLRSPIRKYSR